MSNKAERDNSSGYNWYERGVDNKKSTRGEPQRAIHDSHFGHLGIFKGSIDLEVARVP